MNPQHVVTWRYMASVVIPPWLVSYVGFFFFNPKKKKIKLNLPTVKFSELTQTV